jgi:hypothetical protein
VPGPCDFQFSLWDAAEEGAMLGPLSSVYNYNEYLFGIEELAGSIDGKPISSSLIGPGCGNCEFTWGLGVWALRENLFWFRVSRVR